MTTTFLAALGSSHAGAQTRSLWTIAEEASIPTVGLRAIIPSHYMVYSLDFESMSQVLDSAPHESAGGTLTVTLPLPDGKFEDFAVAETHVMHPALAEKFRDIKTFVGQGIDDPTATARLDYTPAGFHAQVLSPRGAFYIDPYQMGSTKTYTVYYRSDYPLPAGKGLFEEKRFELDPQRQAEIDARIASGATSKVGDNLLTFRLAMACTGEYAEFHSAPNAANVGAAIGAMTTTVSRVTGIYEREVAIRFQLVAGNNNIVFLDPATDPFDNTSCDNDIDTNQMVCDNTVGSANYDIGHVVGTGGGGLAAPGGCNSTNDKARGCTGSPSPVGDPFDVDFVAHEIGHQLGANHTWTGTNGNCTAGSFAPGTSYEPASGSTIMGYAGICGSDDLQANSDPYFHTASFDEIVAFTRPPPGCPTSTATGNNPPTSNAGVGGVTIPRSTPFTLTGSGSDADGGDVLTYSWEQYDAGAQNGNPVDCTYAGPLFRSFPPTTSPTRTFPRLPDVLNNTTSFGEVLPCATRSMNFRLTVRDNRADGGGVAHSQISIDVDGGSGPLSLMFPNGGEELAQNTQHTIVWAVNGTNTAPVNATTVDILLSTDGGLTFPTVLADDTPNDGSEEVTIPMVMGDAARIRIEAQLNDTVCFFDVSNADFRITTAVSVALSSFELSQDASAVAVAWQMAVEHDVRGYHIWRTQDDEDNYVRVTPALISANGGTYRFLDRQVRAGTAYRYRLEAVGRSGASHLFEPERVTVSNVTARRVALHEAHPNPFNPKTTIAFDLTRAGSTRLTIYDAAGRLVRTLIEREMSAGSHSVQWNGLDDNGRSVGSGTYLYTLETETESVSQKMVLMK